MKYLIEPWAHQRQAIELAAKQQDFALFFEMGCLSGSSIIKVNRAKGSRSYSIESLFRKFHGVELSEREKGFDLNIPTYCRSWDGEGIRLNRVINVLKQGIKPVHKLSLIGGKQIKLTSNHEVLTQRGFIEASKLQIGIDAVATDSLVRHKKTGSGKSKEKPRYSTNQVGQFHPYAYWTSLRGKPIWQIEIHRIVYDSFQNGLSVEEFKRKTFSQNSLIFTDPAKFHIHHKDANHRNNSASNLEKLPAKEHFRHHCAGYENFKHGNVIYCQVENLTYAGEEMTYDVVCENPHRNFVANEMVVHNCGKTSTIINILRQRYEQAIGVKKTLILCPPIVVNNWVKEFAMHSDINPALIIPLVGPGKKRLDRLKKARYTTELFWSAGTTKDEFIAITNYEALLNKELLDALKLWKPEIIVFDESHKCKDVSAKRTKAAIALSAEASHCYILTGTPTPQSPMDLFAQFLLLDRGATFGKSYFAFRARYFWDRNSGMPKDRHFPDWQIRDGSLFELNKRVAAKAMRVTKEEALDLPPLVRQTIEVELEPTQKKLYEEMRDDYVAFLDSDACVGDLAITRALRLQQIVSGYCKLESGTERSFGDTPRIAAVRELLGDLTPCHKVIVWAVFHQNYHELRKVCEALKVKYVEVHGGISAKDKDLSVELFNNDPSYRVLIGNQQAGGIGINLTAASYSIFYSRNFSLEQDLQAESRNHRGGSREAGHEKITRIDILAKDTIDEIVLTSLANKQNISEELLKNLRKKL